MSDWKRRTKEVPLEDLPSEMASVFYRYIEKHNLGPILSDALMCIQTDSEKTKTGWMGSQETVRMAAIVTPRWLVWSVEQPKSPALALSAQLIDITVQDYAQTAFAAMVPDSGVQVSGVFTDARDGASAFIGLDQSEAGQKFRQTLIQAAVDAKK
jgi:hypothetical protein